MFSDNYQFVDCIKKELLSKNIYVYTMSGEIIELPMDSTIIDFAYRIHTDIGNKMIGGVVNGEYVDVDYVLKNKDRVRIVVDELSYCSHEEWLDKAKTSLAKRKIKEFNKKWK